MESLPLFTAKLCGQVQGVATGREDAEQRIAAWLQQYDTQGNHRTGTAVDTASAKWLAEQVRHCGANAALEPFILNRIDPSRCYLRVAERRLDGVPVFDASFTSPEGIHGRLGELGSDAEIAVIESEPYKVAEPGIEQRKQVLQARRSAHKAAVVLTAGTRPGLHLLNASSFLKPFGPPMLQVSSSEREWLQKLAGKGAEVTLVVYAERHESDAFNVVTRLRGRDPLLPPVVVMAPRSAWWQSVAEQGTRLVCWLEAIRLISAGTLLRDCYFVALSGHELGLLGIEAYMKRRPELIKKAHCWMFFGSDVGSPDEPTVVHASDAELERWAIDAMAKEGLRPDESARHDSVARGEAGVIQKAGGRFVTIVSGSDAYHNPVDRWPGAVDVALLSRYARAFANGLLQLANQH